MSLGVVEILSGVNLIKQILGKADLGGGGNKDGGQISRDEFEELVEKYSSQLMEKLQQVHQTKENPDSLNAIEYLKQQGKLNETLDPVLFDLMDGDKNGQLEGQEITDLQDFLSNYNREVLIQNTGAEKKSPYQVLNTMVDDYLKEN